MLLYSNSNSKKFCNFGLNRFFVPFLMNNFDNIFSSKVLTGCNLMFVRTTPFWGLTKDYWVILPRDEKTLDELILIWHKTLDPYCTSRKYKYTREQAQHIKEHDLQRAKLSFNPIMELTKAAVIAELKGIESNSQEMVDLLNPIFVEQQRGKLEANLMFSELREKLEELEPNEDDKVYTDPFSRSIKPEFASVCKTLFSMKAPSIYFDLMSYSEAIATMPEDHGCWVMQFRTRQGDVKLKNTRKPHKHNKHLCFR